MVQIAFRKIAMTFGRSREIILLKRFSSPQLKTSKSRKKFMAGLCLRVGF